MGNLGKDAFKGSVSLDSANLQVVVNPPAAKVAKVAEFMPEQTRQLKKEEK